MQDFIYLIRAFKDEKQHFRKKTHKPPSTEVVGDSEEALEGQASKLGQRPLLRSLERKRTGESEERGRKGEKERGENEGGEVIKINHASSGSYRDVLKETIQPGRKRLNVCPLILRAWFPLV